QDFNFEPIDHWHAHDAPDRRGMTENRYVRGYWAYWDALVEKKPGLLIDSCASGGRRNDLETLRRAVPLHTSDFDYGHSIGRQSRTYGLSFWAPVFGNAAWLPLERIDPYVFRSGMGFMMGLGYDLRRRDFDTQKLRKMLADWRADAALYAADYYPLTEYSTR